MADLKSPTLIWIKGGMFLLIGLLGSVLILLRAPSFSLALLLAITIWAFCRCYYFAFYVVERYVDSSYRFAGLIDFARHALGNRSQRVSNEASASSGEGPDPHPSS